MLEMKTCRILRVYPDQRRPNLLIIRVIQKPNPVARRKLLLSVDGKKIKFYEKQPVEIDCFGRHRGGAFCCWLQRSRRAASR
jgi:hypothetical protein